MSQEFWGSGEWGLQGKTFKTEGPACAKALRHSGRSPNSAAQDWAIRQVIRATLSLGG